MKTTQGAAPNHIMSTTHLPMVTNFLIFVKVFHFRERIDEVNILQNHCHFEHILVRYQIIFNFMQCGDNECTLLALHIKKSLII